MDEETELETHCLLVIPLSLAEYLSMGEGVTSVEWMPNADGSATIYKVSATTQGIKYEH